MHANNLCVKNACIIVSVLVKFQGPDRVGDEMEVALSAIGAAATAKILGQEG
jgi:hypothetical protein